MRVSERKPVSPVRIYIRKLLWDRKWDGLYLENGRKRLEYGCRQEVGRHYNKEIW